MSRNTEDDEATGESDRLPALMQALTRDAKRLLAQPLEPGLYLVATPIGNLADITLRALAVLARADIVYCEDTRHSAKLLQHFAIHATTRPLHDHNEDSEMARLLSDLGLGRSIAIISDAGTPLVSDPGFKIVRAAVAAGYSVTSVPGACAAISALAVSGLPTDAFFFAGFQPPKQAARRARLNELKTVPGTLIFFEAPQRVADSLADMKDVLGDRPSVMARELTKLHEELVHGPLSHVLEVIGGRELKGEVVLLAGPPLDIAVTDDEIVSRLDVALQSMRLKDAANAVADALSVPKTRVYNLGLRAKSEGL